MKLKFYLRGLGIGILVTAVIMGIAASRDRQLTDEEIKERARELGMVESVVLSDMASSEASPAVSAAPFPSPKESLSPAPEADKSPSPSPDTEESPSPSSEAEESPSSSPETDVSPSPSPAVSPTSSPEADKSPSPSPESEPSALPENSPEDSSGASPDAIPPAASETVSITIRSGQSSVAVSKLLEEAGLVESASAYDKYLCENGYDNRIKSGTHQIPIGATEEEIALIITGGQQR